MKQTVDIIRSVRRTISIEITDTGSILVRAPLTARDQEIRTFLERKKEWILKHQAKMQDHVKQAEQIGRFTDAEKKEMRALAERIIPERVFYFAGLMNVQPNKIGFRFQKTKWGSCTSQKHITFNCLLVKAPPYVLDYVVVHELCHIKQMNHSAKFYALLASVLPDYKQAEKWLKTEGQVLMIQSK